MSARSALRLLVFILLPGLIAVEASGVADVVRLSAAHDGHLVGNRFALPFIEDVQGNPFAFVAVYDCGGQGHTHADIISPAVTAWNNTGGVKFYYTPGATTTCNIDGFPAVADGRISVGHNDSVPRADFRGVAEPLDAVRDNDLGTEGDTGMYWLRKGRIRISSGSHSTSIMVHELGHAAGLSDLYNHGEAPPCINAHTHNPDTTIMDCTVGATPGQHDIDNLDLLYKRAPAQVNDFRVTGSTLSTGHDPLASVMFAWTDRSFNEQYQFIAIDNDEDGVGEGLPIVAVRDGEGATWSGLQAATRYCFFIQPRNAYGVLAPRSTHACVTTASPGLWPPRVLTSSFSSTTTNRIGWSKVPGASHYHLCTDFSPSGSFASCSGPLPGAWFDAPLPSQDRVQWYSKVKACDIWDRCSPPSSTFTLTERVDVGIWDYVFTLSRNVDVVELQFVNFMPNLNALLLHIRNGNSPSSPAVADTACILVNSISPLAKYPAASFGSGEVGTQGHSVLSAAQCGSGHAGDSPYIGWGSRPPGWWSLVP
jgi:hypothetical protein